ncbi:MAG: hypothetical protein WC822_07255 [Candidatus Paceibacterota bacterium]|jgi:hypothetical protein
MEELAKKLIADAQGELDELKKIKDIHSAAEAVPQVVAFVEKHAADVKGADKRALAVAIINELVDIPLVPERIEAVIIGWAIDAAVAALNKLVGKDWLEKLKLA